jgi:hypothetical protein
MMKVQRRIFDALALLLFLSLCVGCASGKSSTKAEDPKNEMPKAGFLSSYSNLKSSDGESGISDWTYVNPKVDLTQYDKVMVDHVTIFYSEDADYKGIDASELSELSEVFHKAIIAALSPAYPMTDKPGPGVMRIRLAIVDLVPTSRVQSTISTILPIGLVVSLVKKGVTGAHTGMGSVSFEGEVLDSVSGAQLAAAMDHEYGKKYKLTKSMTKWGHAEDVMKGWATTLRSRMDKLVGKKK